MIGNRLLYMGLLVCLSATSAHAQTDLLWQHSDGRLAVWKMQGSVMRVVTPWVPASYPIRAGSWSPRATSTSMAILITSFNIKQTADWPSG